MRKAKQQWSILHVEKHCSQKRFRWGTDAHFYAVPAFFVGEGDSSVEVFRDKILFDTGSVHEIGGHDWGIRFGGLEKVVPKSYLRMYASADVVGYVDPLQANWFDVGDIVRLSVSPSRFRLLQNMYAKSLRWPECL